MLARPSVTSFRALALASLSRGRDYLVLVDEVADLAARVFERIAQSGALLVEKGDLLGDLVVLSLGGLLQLVDLRGKLLVFRENGIRPSSCFF